MTYYDLKTKEQIEIDDNNKGLSFFYNNVFGRVVLKLLTTKFITNTYAKYMTSSLSKRKIKKFIKKNNINMDDYKEEEYHSFNDFFMRTIKKDKRPIEDGLFAIADSKLSVYKIDGNTNLKIKNSVYTIDELTHGNDQSYYKNGYALVFRLCVDDYHHYVYLDNGKFIDKRFIEGKFHTVQPIALKKYKVFSENTREVTYIDTKKYGRVCYIEVGGMMGGKIVNEEKLRFKRGEEKGHFEFGGSTVVLLIPEGKAKINRAILKNTKNDIETIVKLGQNIE